MECPSCKQPIKDGERIAEVRVGWFKEATNDIEVDYQDAFLHVRCYDKVVAGEHPHQGEH